MRQRRRRVVNTQFQALVALAPTPWSVAALVDRVAARRGRPIRILDHPLSSSDATGYWIATEVSDYIVVPEDAVGARRDAIVGHELAHIVLGHEAKLSAEDGAALVAVLAPHSSRELIARFLPRSGYESGPEQEAEALATRLITWSQSRDAGDADGTELGRLTTRLL